MVMHCVFGHDSRDTSEVRSQKPCEHYGRSDTFSMDDDLAAGSVSRDLSGIMEFTITKIRLLRITDQFKVV